MRYRIFGSRTGLRVSELALGTGNFGSRWSPGASADEARAILAAYRDAGGNFIDTADAYQRGEAEEILGAMIGELGSAARDGLVIASKYGLGSEGFDGLHATGNSRKAMVRAAELSLRRLGTDRLDIYWAHMCDGVTPIDEILRGFDDLVRDGKILHAGLSNFPAWRIARGALLADIRGWAPLAALQMEYNLVERTADREHLPMAAALGIAACLYSPLAAGLLTGKYRGATQAPTSAIRALVRQEGGPRETAILDMLFAIADETGTSPTEVAIAWLRGRAARAGHAQIPILGPRSLAQLQPALAALALDLDDDRMARLDAVSAVPLGAPHEMIGHPRSKDKMFAGLYDRVTEGPAVA